MDAALGTPQRSEFDRRGVVTAEFATINDIETKALWAWPPIELAACHGWIMRAGEGHTNRANSVQTLAFDSTAIDAAIDQVETWYQARNLRPCFKICSAVLPASLPEQLADRGYQIITPSDVMVLPLDHAADADGQIDLQSRPSPAVMNVMMGGASSESRAARARLLARIKKPAIYALLSINDLPVATGMAVLDDDIGTIAGMTVAPEHRRYGYGRQILGRLCAWLTSMGASTATLQVEQDNLPACRLYRTAGFRTIYDYRYLKRTLQR